MRTSEQQALEIFKQVPSRLVGVVANGVRADFNNAGYQQYIFSDLDSLQTKVGAR